MNDKDTLKRRIYALEFALWELHLYTDTHPNCAEALKKQEEYSERVGALKAEYETKYGLIGETSTNTSRCAWIADPWPWDPADNMDGETEVRK